MVPPRQLYSSLLHNCVAWPRCSERPRPHPSSRSIRHRGPWHPLPCTRGPGARWQVAEAVVQVEDARQAIHSLSTGAAS
jgi:hypothetical protein